MAAIIVAAVAGVASVHARGRPSRSDQYQPQRERDRDGLRLVRGAEFARGVANVKFDGLFGDVQDFRRLRIGFSPRRPGQGVGLPISEKGRGIFRAARLELLSFIRLHALDVYETVYPVDNNNLQIGMLLFQLEYEFAYRVLPKENNKS